MWSSSSIRAVLLVSAITFLGCDRDEAGPLDPLAPPSSTATVAPLLTSASGAISGRYVVVFKSHVSPADAEPLVAELGGTLHFTYRSSLKGFAATLSPAGVRALQRDARVAYVTEDARAFPKGRQTGAPWGLARIDQRSRLPADGVYDYARTGEGVHVYVIDSGIRTTHEEFGGRASVGADFVDDDLDGQDCLGHGTHVAGTIGGATFGVAKEVELVAVRVFGCDDYYEYEYTTSWSTILAAVDWVTANADKPAVANMSLSGPYNAAVDQAVQSSIASGVVYTVAGGDWDSSCQLSPASTPAAITVGGSDSYDRGYYGYGRCLDLFAPGHSIVSAWSTDDDAATTESGTSMAAAHAAGVAALYLEGSPGATPAAVAQAIKSSGTLNKLYLYDSAAPNVLLYSGLTPEATLISLNPSNLYLTLLRTVGGAPALRRDGAHTPVAFRASGQGGVRAETAGRPGAVYAAAVGESVSGDVVLKNVGASTVEWGATSNQTWAAPSPDGGTLAPGANAIMSVTASGAGLVSGSYGAGVFVDDVGAAGASQSLYVQLDVIDGQVLPVGGAASGLSGALRSYKYYAVTIPAGLPELNISINGGTGDADLYVDYYDVPTYVDWDCGPRRSSNVESCFVAVPPAGTYYILLYGYAAYSGVTLSASAGGPPTAPAGLTGTAASGTAINLSWSDRSSNEVDFELQRALLTGGSWGSWTPLARPVANSNVWQSSGLVASETYRHRIRACNASGCSSWVTSAGVTTLGIPKAPSSFTYSSVAGPAVRLGWADNSGNEAEFQIERRPQTARGFGPYKLLTRTAAGATAHTDATVKAGNVIQYRIRACNAQGCSAYLESGVVTVPAPPAVPKSFAAAASGANAIRLTWVDASTNEVDFNVQRQVKVGAKFTEFTDLARPAAGATSYTDEGLAAGTYKYRIQACNAAGCSAFVTSRTVTLR